MKKEILKKLRQIKRVAQQTGMAGSVYVYFSVEGLPDWNEWDNILGSITEFPRHKHVFSVTQELSVYVMLSV